MMWLDGLLVVPAVGIRMVPNYKTVTEFQQKISNYLDYLASKKLEGDKFNIKPFDNWGYLIEVVEGGFSFNIGPSNSIIQFSYNITEEKSPGGFPKIKIPELKSYSNLLDDIQKYFNKFIEIIASIDGCRYDRIGVVADAVLNKEAIPPGASDWIDGLGKLIGGDFKESESRIVSKIGENDNYYEQCHHHLRFDKDKPDMGYIFKLDWQRIYKEPEIYKNKNVKVALDDTIKLAKEYFAKFGEGGIQDE